MGHVKGHTDWTNILYLSAGLLMDLSSVMVVFQSRSSWGIRENCHLWKLLKALNVKKLWGDVTKLLMHSWLTLLSLFIMHNDVVLNCICNFERKISFMPVYIVIQVLNKCLIFWVQTWLMRGLRTLLKNGLRNKH